MTRYPTSARLAFALGLAASTLALSACHPKPKTEAASDKPPATVAPLGFALPDKDVQVTLTLPEPIKLYPELHTRLYNEGKAELTAFVDQAHKDRAEASASGMDEPAYYHFINWKIAAQSTRLVSLYAEEEEYAGGAHPNSSFQALLWDKTKDDLISPARLFANGADMKSVDAYVCKQIEAERSKRNSEPTSQTGSGFDCPKFADSKLILIPSTVSGKIGAIDALFAPYEVGPYAEGPYEVRVPQSQLRSVLASDYSDQFAGDAVKDVALPDPDSNNDKAPQ